GREAQNREQSPARQPQYYLLLKPGLRSTAVQLAGNAAVCGKIGGVVGIEQVQLGSSHPRLPCSRPEGGFREVHRYPHPLPVYITNRFNRKLARVVVWIQSVLKAMPVYLLPEIASLIEKPDSHNGNAQIARRLELISGDVAQAARVDGQSLTQHEFHTEV